LRVLVVDDDPAVRLVCRVNLEAEGFHVAEAASGAEALKQCLADPPDVLILDVMMPSLSGWEVAQRIRNDGASRDVRIIFLTALTSDQARQRADIYGGTFLAKPFDPLALPRIIRDLSTRAR
jgi:two-component system, OmpR family, alkaline phosphatase synthesis response regulator PhoP